MVLSFQDIATWVPLVDGMLMGVLLIVAVKMFRVPDEARLSTRLGELEVTLRGLIREADGAGKALNDQLLKRQDALQKTLLDLSTSESRLQSLLERGDALKQSLETEIRKGAKIREELFVLPVEPERIEIPVVVEPPPPSFNAVSRKPSLEAQIEVEKEEPTPSTSVNQEMEALYRAAERMLKAGRDIQTVIELTDLPAEHIKVLSEIISDQRQTSQSVTSEPVQAADNRLGVLGTIKRQVQTI